MSLDSPSLNGRNIEQKVGQKERLQLRPKQASCTIFLLIADLIIKKIIKFDGIKKC
jgi:hypothetical protein